MIDSFWIIVQNLYQRMGSKSPVNSYHNLATFIDRNHMNDAVMVVEDEIIRRPLKGPVFRTPPSRGSSTQCASPAVMELLVLSRKPTGSSASHLREPTSAPTRDVQQQLAMALCDIHQALRPVLDHSQSRTSHKLASIKVNVV